jgi:hypothetical protein
MEEEGRVLTLLAGLESLLDRQLGSKRFERWSVLGRVKRAEVRAD